MRNPLRQVLALDEFHHQRADPVRVFKTVDVRDVGVIQRRKGLGFACEPGEPVGVAREEIGQHFDRDVAIQRRITRPVHFAHPAGPEGGKDLVRAESGTGGEGQTLAMDYTGRASARTVLLAGNAAVST